MGCGNTRTKGLRFNGSQRSAAVRPRGYVVAAIRRAPPAGLRGLGRRLRRPTSRNLEVSAGLRRPYGRRNRRRGGCSPRPCTRNPEVPAQACRLRPPATAPALPATPPPPPGNLPGGRRPPWGPQRGFPYWPEPRSRGPTPKPPSVPAWLSPMPSLLLAPSPRQWQRWAAGLTY